MTPHGHIAIPLDTAANREPFLNATLNRALARLQRRSHLKIFFSVVFHRLVMFAQDLEQTVVML